MSNKTSYNLNVKSTETIFSKFGKKVIHEKIKMKDDNVLDWYYLDTPDSVLIVPVTKEYKTILVQQNKFNLKRYTQEFPAGGVDSKMNGNILDAAKNELFEETGYTSNKFISLGKYYPLPSETNRWVHIYLALGVQKISEPVLDNQIEKYFDMSISEFSLNDLIKDPKLLDGLEHRFALNLTEKYLKEKKLI